MSSTDTTAKRKTVSKKKAATRKKTAHKKVAIKKKAAATRKTASPKPKTVKTSDVTGLHPVLPYAVAATFIFLTAALTMLMTSLLGETSDTIKRLEEATDKIQKSPSLLAEARESFASPSGTGVTTSSANTVSPETSAQPVSPAAITDIADSQAASNAAKNPVTVKKPDTVASSHNLPARSAERTYILQTKERANQVFLTHQQNIAQIRKRIQENVDKHEQQIDTYIIAQMQAMNDEITRIENILRPIASPRAVETYQKMIDRRRESFNRMMQERKKLLQDIRQRRNELRQRYTYLLQDIKQAVS